MQLTTEATHFLMSQGQASSAGTKSSSPLKSHSLPGRPRIGIVSRVQIQLTTEATHILKSQGQASSAGFKYNLPQKPLTSLRAKDRHCEQGPNPAHHGSHSQTGDPRTGIVSRV